MNWQTAAWVALGGGAGAAARAAASYWLQKYAPGAFPLATFAVNLAGCAALGFLAGLEARGGLSRAARLALAAGFCGGFTTFSTFSLEGLTLLRAGSFGLFALYGLGSWAGGLAAVWGGYQIGLRAAG